MSRPEWNDHFDNDREAGPVVSVDVIIVDVLKDARDALGIRPDYVPLGPALDNPRRSSQFASLAQALDAAIAKAEGGASE